MKVIRRNIFETNSSSTHVMTIVSTEDYQDGENGKKVYDMWTDTLVPGEKAKEEDEYFPYEENCMVDDYYGGYREIEIDDNGNKTLGEYIETRFLTFTDFDSYYYNMNESIFAEDTPDGKGTVFGHYGYDG